MCGDNAAHVLIAHGVPHRTTWPRHQCAALGRHHVQGYQVLRRRRGPSPRGVPRLRLLRHRCSLFSFSSFMQPTLICFLFDRTCNQTVTDQKFKPKPTSIFLAPPPFPFLIFLRLFPRLRITPLSLFSLFISLSWDPSILGRQLIGCGGYNGPIGVSNQIDPQSQHTNLGGRSQSKRRVIFSKSFTCLIDTPLAHTLVLYFLVESLRDPIQASSGYIPSLYLFFSRAHRMFPRLF